MKYYIKLLILYCLIAPVVKAQDLLLSGNISYPKDSGVIVVTDHGISNSGKVDVSAKLQELIDTKGGFNTFYFPEGTYLLSDTVSLKKNTRVTFVGENRGKTIFRLKDNCPGFQDADNPKKVLQSCQQRAVAFWINWANFTVDIGKNNPGAIGMEFGANNQGSLRNVTINAGQNSGVLGLDLAGQGMGPLLVDNVLVDGFDVGLAVWRGVRTIHNLELRNQRKLGIRNKGAGIFARKLNINGKVPGYLGENDPNSESAVPVLVLLDSEWKGIGTAIQGGEVYLRKVKLQHFIKSVDQLAGGNFLPLSIGGIKEYCNRPMVSLFGCRESTKINPPETPQVPWTNDFSKWANILKFRKSEDGKDDAPAVQRAIDSGAEVIYFPNIKEAGDGRKQPEYNLASKIIIKPNVSRIIGCGSLITHNNKGREGNYLWVTEGKSNKPLVIEYLMSLYSLKMCMRLEHKSTRPLIIKSSTEIMFKSSKEAGDVYAEDITGLGWRLNNKKAWLSQFNLEGGIPKVESHGSDIWCLGFKSEMEGDILHCYGGSAEVFGSMFYGGPGITSMFYAENADLTVVMAYEIIGSIHPRGYFTFVEEIQNGTRRSLTRGMDGVYRRDPRASIVPFFVGKSSASGGKPIPWIQSGQDKRWGIGEAVNWTPEFKAGKDAVFEAVNLPEGLTIDANTGKITGIARKPVRQFVELIVKDEDGTAKSTARFNVGCPSFDMEEVFNLKLGVKSEIKVNVKDLSNDKKGSVNVKVKGCPDGMRFDSRRMVIHGEPKAAGEYLIQATARNKAGGTRHDFKFLVTE